jgi:hypothetical protein
MFSVVAAKDRISSRLRDRGDVIGLLRPLFCNEEVNIDAVSSMGVVPNDFLYHNEISPKSVLSLDPSNYENLLRAINQRIPGTDATDTEREFAYITPSRSQKDYLRELRTRGIVDDLFIKDVLMVDFTRPIFSDARCDLLEGFAPTGLQAADMTPDKLRKEFIDNLKGAPRGSAAAQLRAYFEASKKGKEGNHFKVAEKFKEACIDRTKDFVDIPLGSGTVKVNAFQRDVMRLRSLYRKIAFRDGEADDLDGSDAHARSVFEFPATLPVDDIEVTTSASPDELLRVHPQARLHPETCEITHEFVAVDR